MTSRVFTAAVAALTLLGAAAPGVSALAQPHTPGGHTAGGHGSGGAHTAAVVGGHGAGGGGGGGHRGGGGYRGGGGRNRY